MTTIDFSELESIIEINTLCNIQLSTEKRGGVSDANIISSQGVVTLDGWGPYGDGDHTSCSVESLNR